MWCLRSAIWRKCGSECRNGCELWGFARWVLAVANRVRRVGSGFNRAFHLENGCSDCKNGVFVFRFLYFSGLVRRNSFVNVVFAVYDMAKVRCKVPKWLRFMGFAWWVAAVGSRNVGFIGCGIGFCCHVRAVSGRERGLLCVESGVCVIGLFRFRVVKRKRTPCDVPKIKMKKSNTGSTNLFLLFRFRRFRGAKVVFFFGFGKKWVCFSGFQSVFSVFSVFIAGFSWFKCGVRGLRSGSLRFLSGRAARGRGVWCARFRGRGVGNGRLRGRV